VQTRVSKHYVYVIYSIVELNVWLCAGIKLGAAIIERYTIQASVLVANACY
jgi:hypothetical protein